MRFSPRLLARVVPLLVVLVLLGLRLWPNLLAPASVSPPRIPAPESDDASGSVPAAAPADPTTVNAALLAAARAHASHVEIEARGRVTRLLPDDTEGARHQRFLVRIADGSRFSWRTTAILLRVSRCSRGTRWRSAASTSGTSAVAWSTGRTMIRRGGTSRAGWSTMVVATTDLREERPPHGTSVTVQARHRRSALRRLASTQRMPAPQCSAPERSHRPATRRAAPS